MRTRVRTWTVQRLTPAGWLDVDQAQSFSSIVPIFCEQQGIHGASRVRLLRDGRPLRSDNPPTLF